MNRKMALWKAHQLGPLQSAVMNNLWLHGPLSAVELHERLLKLQDCAYTTIHTELSRLLKKGLVEKHGRNLETRYAAAMTRDVYLSATVKQTITDLIGTHGAAAIHGFIELVAEDDDAFDTLRKAIRTRPKR